MTGASYTQPGFGTFTYDTETQQAGALKMTYVDVDGTIGLPKDTDFNDLPWFYVDYDAQFDLKDLSGESIVDLTKRLETDQSLARAFEFNRMGVDTENKRQVAEGLAAYKNTKLIGGDATVDNAFLRPEDFLVTSCMMTDSRMSQELSDCVSKAKQSFKMQK